MRCSLDPVGVADILEAQQPDQPARFFRKPSDERAPLAQILEKPRTARAARIAAQKLGYRNDSVGVLPGEDEQRERGCKMEWHVWSPGLDPP